MQQDSGDIFQRHTSDHGATSPTPAQASDGSGRNAPHTQTQTSYGVRIATKGCSVNNAWTAENEGMSHNLHTSASSVTPTRELTATVIYKHGNAAYAARLDGPSRQLLSNMLHQACNQPPIRKSHMCAHPRRSHINKHRNAETPRQLHDKRLSTHVASSALLWRLARLWSQNACACVWPPWQPRPLWPLPAAPPPPSLLPLLHLLPASLPR
jgi:hypothetical protein